MAFVDRKLLPMKVFYFCHLGVVSLLIIYVTNYFQSIGLTYTEISITGFVAAWAGFFARTLVGGIADRLQRFRETMIFTSISSAVAFCLMLLIPARAVPRSATLNMSHLAPDNPSSFHWIGRLCVPPHGGNESSPEYRWPSQLERCDVRGLVSKTGLLAVKKMHVMELTLGSSPECRDVRMELSLNSTFFGSQTFNTTWMCQEVLYPSFANFSSSFMDVFRGLELGCDNGRSAALATMGEGSEGAMVRLGVTFALALVLRTLAYTTYSPNLSLADAVTFSLLGETRRHRYGHTRLFGSLGFLVFAVVSSSVMISVIPSLQFPILFTLYAVIMVVASVSVGCMPLKDVQIRRGDNVGFVKSLGLMCTNVDVSVFFLFTLAGGMCMALVENYLIPAVCDLLHPPSSIYGLMSAMMVISETPVVGVSGAIIQRLGELQCMSLSFLAWALRLLSYSLVRNYWLLLAVELLHGVAFGLFFPAMTTYASRIAPPGMEATLQGLTSGVYFGAGVSIGSLAAGPLFDRLDKRVVFMICAAFALLCALLLAAYSTLRRCTAPRDQQQPSPTPTPPRFSHDYEGKNTESWANPEENPEIPLKTFQ